MHKLFLTVILVFTFSLVGTAQQFKYSFENLSLLDALKEVESNSNLLISYKIEDVRSIIINIEIESNSPDDLMTKLLDQSPLEFSKVDDRYLIKNTGNKLRLSARVLDFETNEPLAYASVFLSNKLGSYTDENGNFELYVKQDQLEGINSVTISYVSYEPIILDIDDLLNDNSPTILLNTQSFEEDFIVIKDYISDGIQLNQNGASTEIRPDMISILPGLTNADVYQSIRFLPGINASSSNSSELRIRGGNPDQNLILWDNIPIYHTAHYFGMVSSIDPNMVDEIKVFRGGFNAEYGTRVAGVIDLNSFSEYSEESNYRVGLDMIQASISGRNNFGKNGNTSIKYALRRSYSDLIETPTMNNINKLIHQSFNLGNKELALLPEHIKVKDNFEFYDAHFSFKTRIGERDEIRASGLMVNNDIFNQIVDDKREEVQNDSLNLSNIGASINYKHKWSNNLSSEIQMVYTNYSYDYDYELIEEGSPEPKIFGTKNNEIKDMQLSSKFSWRNSNNQLFDLAYQYVSYDIGFRVLEENRNANPVDDESSKQSDLHSVFFNFMNPISKKLGLNLGFRYNYFEVTSGSYFEPRIRLSYAVNNDLSLHYNFGRHYQFISQLSDFRGNNNGLTTLIWSLGDRRGVPVQNSLIHQLGFIYEKNQWLFDVQIYHREMDGLSSRAYDLEAMPNSMPIVGSSTAKGIDFLIKRRFGKLRSWLSYSFSESTMNFEDISFDDFPSEFDQRHIVKWTNQVSINNWNFALGYQYFTGFPYSEIVDFNVIPRPNGNDLFEPIYDGINSQNLNSTHELNLSASLNFSNKKKSYFGNLAISFINILDSRNQIDRNYLVDKPMNKPARIDFVDKFNLGFTPNLRIQIEW